MKSLITLCLTSSALLIGAIGAQAATFIDSFNHGEVNLEVTNRDVSKAMSVTAAEILGGERDVLLEFTPPTAGAATLKIDLDMTENDFRHNNEVDVASTATVIYDGVDDNGLGGGSGIDLLSLGNKFSLDIQAIDLTAELGISLMDVGGATDSIVRNGLEEGTVEFNFADFNNVDLSKISTITLQSTSISSEDLRADTLLVDGTPNTDDPEPKPTPEPTTILGILFSLTCGALFKKKK